MPRSVAGAIIGGGLLAGLIDITYACAYTYFFGSGATPDRVFKYVASGWFGIDAARAGGGEMIALGAISHFGIVVVMAAVYVLARLRVRVLATKWFLFGPLYGAALYLAMNFIVVPLSNAPDPQFPFWPTFTGVIVHMIGIGMVIAFFAAKIEHAPAT